MKSGRHILLATPEGRSAVGWQVLRLTLAVLIAAHGWVRLVDGGVVPFGEWLTGRGVPLGFAIAAAVTAVEILGTPLLALRRLIIPLTSIYSLVYLAGIILVHAPVGWFVVGKGRNGAEYSVLLLVALVCVGLQEVRWRARAE